MLCHSSPFRTHAYCIRGFVGVVTFSSPFIVRFLRGVFHCFLKDHTDWVTWMESVSEPCGLTTGVPQGSGLGHIFFSLYTESLGSVTHSPGLSDHRYAGDTKLIQSFSETQLLWTIFLKVIIDKTELIFLPGKACPTHNLPINSVVPATWTPRTLGVTLEHQLSLAGCRHHCA